MCLYGVWIKKVTQTNPLDGTVVKSDIIESYTKDTPMQTELGAWDPSTNLGPDPREADVKDTENLMKGKWFRWIDRRFSHPL